MAGRGSPVFVGAVSTDRPPRLTLTAAKPETPKPRRIQIGRGEDATIEGKAK